MRTTYLRRYGRMKVLRDLGRIKGYRRFECLCDCGTIKTVRAGDLQQGLTLSCGCLGVERRNAASVKHGHAGTGSKRTSEYRSWAMMKSRVLNSRFPSFKRYGGRGIKMSARWMSFKNFLNDMGEKPSPKHSIERKNNDGNYTKSNCCWATQIEQSQNTRRNIVITHAGVAEPISWWAREKGINYSTVYYRFRNGLNLFSETNLRSIGKPIKGTAAPL